jgi:hypothetical protein
MKRHTTPPMRGALRSVLVTVTLLQACSTGTERIGVLHTDSSGVTITESTTPQWEDGQGWTVDPVPLLDLSTSGSGLSHEFFRVSDAKFLPGGDIVVANAGTDEVRLYSPEGDLLQSIGREGEGPGEFRRILGLFLLRGDSIGVWEYGGRISLLGSDLTFSRIVSLPHNIWELRSLGDSTILGEMSYPSMAAHEGGNALIREPIPIVLCSLEGDAVDTVAVGAGFEEFMWSNASGDGAGSRPLFGKESHLASWRNEIYMGSADAMEFRVLSSAGQLRKIIRVAAFDLSLSSQDVEAERETRRSPESPAWIRDLVNDLPSPSKRPAYSSFLIDHDGFVWLEMFRARTEREEMRTWMVFHPDGEWLGKVTTPTDFRVFDIGPWGLLGVRTDDLEVEHVQLLSLDRG